MRRIFFPAILAGALLVAADARGDTVYLKKGKKIEGRIISETVIEITIETADGVVRVRATDVVYIRRDAYVRTNKPPRSKEPSRETRPPVEPRGPPASGDPVADVRTLIRAGRTRAARERLDRLPASAPKRDLLVDILRAEARHLERALRLAEARERLVEAGALAPGDTAITREAARLERTIAELRRLVERARALAEAESYKDAAAEFDRAVRLLPGVRAIVGLEIADVCEKLGHDALSEKDAAAIRWYEKAMEADPARTESLKGRYAHARLFPILAQLEDGRFDPAKRALDGLLKIAPDDMQVRYIYGRMLEAKRDWRGARSQFLRAFPSKDRPRTPPATRAGAASLRGLVEKRLGTINDDVRAEKRKRADRARAEPGAAKRLAGRCLVVHYRNTKLAREVLDAAERQIERLAEAAGVRAAGLWTEPCPVYLLPDENAFLESTGQPQWSGGLSHTEAAGGELKRQYLTVYQTAPKLLVKTVPHEVTHLVFSALVGYEGDVPLAVHEGFAVSQEPEFPGRARRHMLRWRRLAGELIPLGKLFGMKSVGAAPELFYAQSASVVGLLVGRKGVATFVSFSKDLAASSEPSRDPALRAKRGVERALSTHYGAKDLETFEREWRDSLDR